MDLPKPVPTGYDAPFWTAAREGRLLVQRCVATGRPQWFPRARSLHVPGGEVEWVESEGRGTVETFTVVARSFYPALPAPYVIAMVRLEEGILLTALVVDADPAEVAIGLPVAVTFRAIEGDQPVPCFAPSGRAS
jgi:uncharacterized OB-fold protein